MPINMKSMALIAILLPLTAMGQRPTVEFAAPTCSIESPYMCKDEDERREMQRRQDQRKDELAGEEASAAAEAARYEAAFEAEQNQFAAHRAQEVKHMQEMWRAAWGSTGQLYKAPPLPPPVWGQAPAPPGNASRQ